MTVAETIKTLSAYRDKNSKALSFKDFEAIGITLVILTSLPQMQKDCIDGVLNLEHVKQEQ